MTNAEVDLANAKLSLIEAQSSMEQDLSALAAAMGIPEQELNVADNLDFTAWNIALKDAQSKAIEERPDLKAQALRQKAAQYNVAYQSKGMSPNLVGSIGYSLTGASPLESDEWTTKISLSVPLSDGGITKAAVKQAEAELAGQDATFKSLINTATREVRQAWQGLGEAASALKAALESQRGANESLKLAQGRYQAGVGTSLEISDAVDKYATAQIKVVTCLYDHKIARLKLEQAMGKVNKS